MQKSIPVKCIAVLLLLMLPFAVSAQYDIPDKPELQTSMYDYANVLNGNEKQVLENKLVNYADTTSTQIVVITIESLKGESIGELTPKWAHEWGIGQADKDNGVLILMAKEERKIWISPGYGVDDRLTAGILGQMIRDVIIPEFKDANYYSGLDKGTDAIIQMLKGKYKAEPEEEDPWWLKALKFLLGSTIIGMIIMLFARLFSMGGGTSYKSSGKSSGRGFKKGFGGGGFSGGGAGGSW